MRDVHYSWPLPFIWNLIEKKHGHSRLRMAAQAPSSFKLIWFDWVLFKLFRFLSSYCCFILLVIDVVLFVLCFINSSHSLAVSYIYIESNDYIYHLLSRDPLPLYKTFSKSFLPSLPYLLFVTLNFNEDSVCDYKIGAARLSNRCGTKDNESGRHG